MCCYVIILSIIYYIYYRIYFSKFQCTWKEEFSPIPTPLYAPALSPTTYLVGIRVQGFDHFHQIIYVIGRVRESSAFFNKQWCPCLGYVRLPGMLIGHPNISITVGMCVRIDHIQLSISANGYSWKVSFLFRPNTLHKFVNHLHCLVLQRSDPQVQCFLDYPALLGRQFQNTCG